MAAGWNRITIQNKITCFYYYTTSYEENRKTSKDLQITSKSIVFCSAARKSWQIRHHQHNYATSSSIQIDWGYFLILGRDSKKTNEMCEKLSHRVMWHLSYQIDSLTQPMAQTNAGASTILNNIYAKTISRPSNYIQIDCVLLRLILSFSLFHYASAYFWFWSQ